MLPNLGNLRKGGKNMYQVLDITMQGIRFFFNHLVFFNLIFAVAVVFFQRKDPKTVWTWLLALYFVPVVGFIFYLLIGTDMHKQKMFRVKEIEDKLNEAIRQQEHKIQSKEYEEDDPDLKGYTDLVLFNLNTTGSVLTDTNDVDIFTDGNEKFDALIQDIREAKEFIHIQYYIIKNDVLFNRIKDVLVEKAKEGVEVRILFDAMGCRSVKPKFWKRLNEAGIETAEFFPALFRRLQLRINYRNHRKIVVIDNKVAYVGGFNIGKEYIGLVPKFGYWRDTHLRIRGEGIMGLELRFLLDWNYAAKDHLFSNPRYMAGFAPAARDNCYMQIIYSGPDTSLEPIRDNYIRLIHKAKEKIYIQTPYFIPDESMLSALLMAIYSGVEVNLMIPCKPDHPFVYWATYSYMGELVMAGANCYIYNDGFLHAKGIVVDDRVLCYGTANMDIRSFALNFEVNAVLYDRNKAKEMTGYFKKDLDKCTRITKSMYTSRKPGLRVKEQVCRLLSPLL